MVEHSILNGKVEHNVIIYTTIHEFYKYLEIFGIKSFTFTPACKCKIISKQNFIKLNTNTSDSKLAKQKHFMIT